MNEISNDKSNTEDNSEMPEKEHPKNTDNQTRLLSILELNSRKSHFVQLMSFSVGIIVSLLTIMQQVFNIGTFRSQETLILMAGALGFGFVLIILSLAITTRRDSEINENIRNISIVTDDNSKLNHDKIVREEAIEAIISPLNDIKIRINQHVKRLQSFALANIIIGSIIAAAGIGVIISLFGKVLDISYSELNTIDNSHYASFFVMIFLPRISVVVFVQIFAYFFLSMYRANLREIRYFQIELSDIELIGEAISISSTNNALPHQIKLADILFDMARYRGDTFRLGLVSDEAVETFQALATQGDLFSKLRPWFQFSKTDSTKSGRPTRREPQNTTTANPSKVTKVRSAVESNEPKAS